MPDHSRPLRLVLGSRSPRRRELLELVMPTARIEVVPPRSPDEPGFEGLADRASIEGRLRDIARAKCDDVLEQLELRPDVSEIDAVITADTTIVATGPDGQLAVLGQPPEDETWADTVADWFRRYYAGRTHDVLTALRVAVPLFRTACECVVSTAVTFTADVESRLDWYLATGEPRGKAGGYAIQGAADVFVTAVQGSISNVVGLPLRELLEAFDQLRVAGSRRSTGGDPQRMVRCFVALGGNIGNVEETFRQALERLDAMPDVRVVQVSRTVRSQPVGEQAGDEFRNAAAELETPLAPLDLLDRLQSVETELGRTRTVHWGPRTLDLDLLLYGNQVIDDPRLRVPHPACWYRRFVLDPLAEIAADVVHPERGLTIGELRSRLLPRSLPVALAGGDPAERSRLIAVLREEFPVVALQEWQAGASATDPALVIRLARNDEADAGELPKSRTLDASRIPPDERLDFVRNVLRSALGE